MNKKKVLVLGATGNQGGSVVQALLKDGHNVTGVTRDVNSPKAKSLIEQGVKMVAVDFSNKENLMDIMKEVDTVFAMTTPGWEGDVVTERKHGMNIVYAAKEANVGHFIFSSVSDANQNTGIPHFDSKFSIEQHLELSGLDYTIVAPAYFYENIFFPYAMDAIIKEGVLRVAMPGDTKLQQIAVEDIGKYVGIVVNKGEEMYGQRINIAGDSISGNEVAKILSTVLGKEIKYEGFSPDYLREQSEDMANMHEWFNNVGYSADLESLKQYGLTTFKDWAMKQEWPALV